MSNLCLICNHNIGYDDSILLVNWLEIHKSCYQYCLNPTFKESSDLERLYLDRQRLESSINEEKWIFSSIWRIFDSKKKDILFNLEQQLSRLTYEIFPLEQSIRNQRDSIKKALTKIYDVWYERPPDWEERQNKVKALYHYNCSLCWSYNNLQVHHMLPINKWWWHDLDNLVLLCRSCHEDEHGNVDFSWPYKNPSSKSVFMGRLEKIKHAIKSNTDIHFHYKKFEWEESIRTITPKWIRQEWRSLCVFWYCHLRKDERVFAIHRMTKISIK